MKPAGIIHSQKSQDNQYCGNILSNYRCRRNSRNIHMKANDKNEIQRNIYKPGKGQNIERSLRVARRSDYACAEVKNQKPRCAEEINFQIER